MIARLLNAGALSISSTDVFLAAWFFLRAHNPLAPVPGKPISVNGGLNPTNRGCKFILRLDSVPESTINTNQVINEGLIQQVSIGKTSIRVDFFLSLCRFPALLYAVNLFNQFDMSLTEG